MTYAKAAIFHRGNAITIMRARSNFNRAITRGFIRLFLPADAILHTSPRYLFSALCLQRFVQSASIGVVTSEKEYRKSENHNYKIDSNKYTETSSTFREYFIAHKSIKIITIIVEIKYLFKI